MERPLLNGAGEMMPDSVRYENSSGGAAHFFDLYELAMLRAYGEPGMSDRAVFDLFFHKLPPQRNYVPTCGLDRCLEDPENLAFRCNTTHLDDYPVFGRHIAAMARNTPLAVVSPDIGRARDRTLSADAGGSHWLPGFKEACR